MTLAPSASFLLPAAFDLTATFLMAMTGVWAAARRGYDAVGAFGLALVAGVGGGLMRDSVFLVQPPVIMHDPSYLAVVLAAVLAGGVTQHLARRFERLMAYVDALAIGVYAVVGSDKALAHEIAPIGAVLVGMCNAVGGGVLRDILTREEPLMFKPGQLYALASLGGCVLYVLLARHYDLATRDAAWISIGATVALRVFAIRFNWITQPFSSWNRWFKRWPGNGGGSAT